MTRSLSDSVATEVRAELGRQRRSGRWLAQQLEVSDAWVSRRLSNEYPMSVDDLDRIAAILEVEPAALLGSAGVAVA